MDLSYFTSIPRSASTSGPRSSAAPFCNLVQMATDQVSVQRYLTAGSMKEAQRSLWIKLWMFCPGARRCSYGTGLVLYAFYKQHGDPLAAGLIAEGRPDSALLRRSRSSRRTAWPAHCRHLRRQHVHHLGGRELARLPPRSVDFKQRHSRSTTASRSRAGAHAPLDGRVIYGVLVTLFAFVIVPDSGRIWSNPSPSSGVIGGPMLGLFLPRHVHQEG